MDTAELASYRMFEYEARLAAREQEALTAHAKETGESAPDLMRRRSTYLARVGGLQTDQALTEAAHHRHRGSSPTRQSTRFLAHGLHEYKGKFNPQLARVLVNMVDPAAEALLDPFCGSGTTLIEGMRLGLSVAGIDQNPLAAWMSKVKIAAQQLAGQPGLVERFDEVADAMRSAMKEAQGSGLVSVADDAFADADMKYLLRWFPAEVLAALCSALEVGRNDGTAVGDVALLCLSNIVRQVSWQLPEDLRVRRRPADWEPPNVAEVFAESAERGRLAFREIEQTASAMKTTQATVLLGSSRDAKSVSGAWAAGRRLVVTSPPYATALPYIDTDRLSIVLLGLAQASGLRNLDQELTGSREWQTREARRWDQARRDNSAELPAPVMDLLNRIEGINAKTSAGFRRLAVPNLLYRYFTHIGETMRAVSSSMTRGEHVVMVVGANRTGKGEHQTTIATPDLLGQLAETCGLAYTELIPLEAWSRFALHSKNSTDVEEAVVMTVTG